MKRFLLLPLALVALVVGCEEPNTEEEPKYLRWVGDIAADPKLDTPQFAPCNEDRILQYHNIGDGFQYDGEMHAIQSVFKEKYKPQELVGQSGWVRIRHVVNCQGEAGRFRLMGSDFDYQAKDFDPRITDQLIQITKSLDGWVAKVYEGNEPIDYYQYLIFKIENGEILEILP